MTRVIAGKVVRIAVVIFVVSVLAFLVFRLAPGDPVAGILSDVGVDQQTYDREYRRLTDELGLDDPLVVQYGDWAKDFVTGDLGKTLRPEQDISQMIGARLPVTLEITFLSVLIALSIAIPWGAIAGYRAGTRVDRSATAVAVGALSLPPFVVGLLLVYLIVFNLDIVKVLIVAGAVLGAVAIAAKAVRANRTPGVGMLRDRFVLRRLAFALLLVVAAIVLVLVVPQFPRQGFTRWSEDPGENLRSIFLPAITLAVLQLGIYIRVLRNDMVTTLQEPFVLSARARGMTPRHVIFREALRPSSLTLITSVGVITGALLGGSVIIESLFSIPGMGSLLIQGVRTKDYRVVQACAVIFAAFFVIITAIVDVTYAFLDPRIRRGRT